MIFPGPSFHSVSYLLAPSPIPSTSATTNFAQGSIAALGCYLVTYLMQWVPGMPYYVAIFIGLLAGVGLGLLIDIGILPLEDIENSIF